MIGPPQTFAASDVSGIRKILSGVIKGQKAGSSERQGEKRKRLFYSERAASLMRNYNRILGFSDGANLLYRDLCAYIGLSRGCQPDEVQMSALTMAQRFCFETSDRAVENYIRELTLSGAIPLLEKCRPGAKGFRTVYRFVLDPFTLAAEQHAAALRATHGERNTATRGPIQIVQDIETADAVSAPQPTDTPPDGSGDEAGDAIETAADGFEEFWRAYPRKAKREAAEEAWLQERIEDRGLLKPILKALEWQRTQPQWTTDNGGFIPYPANWLREKRWQDESPTAAAQASSRRDVEREMQRTREMLMRREAEAQYWAEQVPNEDAGATEG